MSKNPLFLRKNEFLQFVFKDYPDCKVSIGRFNEDDNWEFIIGLDINQRRHEFDKYRLGNKKTNYWIGLTRSDEKKEVPQLSLNERLPHDDDGNEIEAEKKIEGIEGGKVKNFGFKNIESLKIYEGCYQKLCILLAQRPHHLLLLRVHNLGKIYFGNMSLA